MAIIADYTKTILTESETATVTHKVTYPADLPIGDPNYELRGQAVYQTYPKIDETKKTLEKAYIVITITNYYKHQKDLLGNTLFDFSFYVFKNKEDYLTDINAYYYRDDVLGQYHDIKSTDDLRIKAYEILKQQPFLTNIIDD